MKCIIEEDVELTTMLKLVTTVPGVGFILGLNLICFTNEFTSFSTAKQLASYCGVAPFEYKSGSSISGKTKVHPFANRKLKTLLHLASVSSLAYKNEFRSYYDRKVAEGKHKMAVINAIRYKIVKRIVAVIERSSPYVTQGG